MAKELEEININRGSNLHLVDIHRKIIDSIHTKNIGSQMRYFNVMLEATANALLMSEETMNFY